MELPPIIDAEGWTTATGRNGPAPSLAILNGVSGTIRDACGWHVAPVLTQEIRVNGQGGRHLDLDTLKIREAPTGVTVAGEAVTLGEFDWAEEGWLEGHCWGSRPRSIQMALTHGYSLAEIPSVVALFASLTDRSAMIPTAVVREAAGPNSVEYRDPGLLVEDWDVLAPYVLPKSRW